MKITKVSYQKTYSIGPYLTDKVGFEAEISEPTLENLVIETAQDVLSKLAILADQWHKQAHPNLYPSAALQLPENKSYPPSGESQYVPAHTPITYPSGGAPTIDLSFERIEIAIDNAESTEDLKKIKEQNPVLPFALLKHYNKRLEELSEIENKSFTSGLE